MSKNRWQHRGGEQFDVLANRGVQWFLGYGNCLVNHGELIEMDDNHGDDCNALLFVDMTEETRQSLLSFLVRQYRDKRVWCRGAVIVSDCNGGQTNTSSTYCGLRGSMILVFCQSCWWRVSSFDRHSMCAWIASGLLPSLIGGGIARSWSSICMSVT
jgi:hypothetical protein